MKDIKIVNPQTRRDPIRFRGPLSSEDHNSFQDSVVKDITDLAAALNANAQQLLDAQQNIALENSYLKRRIESLEQSLDYREFSFGKQSIKVDKYVDFHDTSTIMFPTTVSERKLATFKGQFGEIFLPQKTVENKFYNLSLRTNEIVQPDGLSVVVTGKFDKLDGKGLIDYERGGLVKEGNPLNAFNGLNESRWLRTVTFPIESDVDEVEVQLTAVVPASISSTANLVEIVPSPEGSVDIVSVATSPNLTNSFVSLDGFEEVKNAVAKRWHFPPRSVEQVRVVLRSRNWREINGKKVFTIGLQEFGMKLIEYQKEYLSSDLFGENATAVIKIDAPNSHVFTRLYRLDPTPNFFNEDVDKRHVRLRLSRTPDLTTVFFDSSLNELPQLSTSNGIAVGASESIYAIYTLKFVESSGGINSPYLVGTTPYLNGLGMLAALQPTNANN